VSERSEREREKEVPAAARPRLTPTTEASTTKELAAEPKRARKEGSGRTEASTSKELATKAKLARGANNHLPSLAFASLARRAHDRRQQPKLARGANNQLIAFSCARFARATSFFVVLASLARR
jgi:hypothetical protein